MLLTLAIVEKDGDQHAHPRRDEAASAASAEGVQAVPRPPAHRVPSGDTARPLTGTARIVA